MNGILAILLAALVALAALCVAQIHGWDWWNAHESAARVDSKARITFFYTDNPCGTAFFCWAEHSVLTSESTPVHAACCSLLRATNVTVELSGREILRALWVLASCFGEGDSS